MDQQETNNKRCTPLWVANLFTFISFLLGMGITVTYFLVSDTSTDTNNIPLPVFRYNENMSYDVINVNVGTSMDPLITNYSKVFCTFDFDESDIHIGDIIVFEINKSLHPDYIPQEDLPSHILHRVVDIETENGKKIYITKGDNNLMVDEERITIETIRCIVFGVVYI